MPKAWIFILLTATFLAGGVATSRAELLYFKNGGRLQAPATVRDGIVKVESAVGVFSFLDQDFLKIVPGFAPEREWQVKRDSALKEGADVRFRAAWWALENGLVPEAVGMLRTVHRADAKHQPTARLVKLLDRLDTPGADRDVTSLSSAIGVPLEAARSPHILLLHQSDPELASLRLDLLERVLTTFYLTFAAHGIELKIPEERLVSVALHDQGDYLRFLRSQHAGAFQTSQGYYHRYFRAVVTLQQPQVVPDQTRAGMSQAPERRDFDRRAVLRSSRLRAIEDGTAAHEMIHLLVNESRLAPSTERFPLWLHEGLAAQFEVVRAGRWAGVGRAHDLRLPDWRRSKGDLDLNFILNDGGFGRGYDPKVYARSWALVYYLRKVHPEKFHDFLEVLRNRTEEFNGASGDHHATKFRLIFGENLVEFQQEWETFIDKLRTPLEEHDLESAESRPNRFFGARN